MEVIEHRNTLKFWAAWFRVFGVHPELVTFPEGV